ncbi:hypothetical protein JCM39194_21480 [Desulfotomaculum varum]
MITKELVERINALARKQRTAGLTPEEKEEQHRLRQQYLKGIRGQVINALNNIKFIEDEGSCSCGQSGRQHQHPLPRGKQGHCGCNRHQHEQKGPLH